MPSIDFFHFFRYTLATIATVYATVITLQSMWSWLVWLSGQDKYISLVRRYVIVQGLRLRFTSFWGDVIICILLCVVFFILWHAHGQMRAMFNAYHAARLAQ
jgi:hypothetical protein